MTTLRRFSYVAFVVACAHLVFGAIVRISGSGMGCGDHWPKCYGRWFPPLDRPDLIIEVSHRYLASILLLSVLALLAAAWSKRSAPGVSGRGGIIRPAALAVALVVTAGLLGAVTVKLLNSPFATLAHWTVAMTLMATLVATVIRTGGFGGDAARAMGVSAKTRRAAYAAAAVALLTVIMGGLTAKYPGAAVACPSFPLCGTNPDVTGPAVHVQLTHRVLAVLLVLHLFGMVMALRKRGEPAVLNRAAHIAFGLGVLQLLVAGAMIGMHLPPVLRSLHQATGVSIWIATFALAYLARIAGGGHGVREPGVPVRPRDLVDAGVIRSGSTPVHSTAVAEGPRRGVVEAKEPWQERASTPERASLSVTTGDTKETPRNTEVGVTAIPALEVFFDRSSPEIEVANVHEPATALLTSASSVSSVATSAPSVVDTPPALSRMAAPKPHSIAVIIARGADL